MRYLVCAILLLPALAQSDEPAGPTRAVPSQATFGEGFSSPAAGATIAISSRAHTAPSLTDWQNSGLVVDRLHVSPRALELRPGDPLSIGELQVLALNPAGQVVERVPLSFSLEGPDGILDFEGFRTFGTDILATGPGQATIWVESLLPTSSGDRLREAIVVNVR